MADDDTLFELFAESCLDQLRGIESAILDLESARPDELGPKVASIFRAAHTIKGDAGAIGATRLASLAHSVESALDAVRQGRLGVAPAMIGELLGVFDVIKAMAEDVRNDAQRDISPHIARIEALLAPSVSSASSDASSRTSPPDDAPPDSLAAPEDSDDPLAPKKNSPGDDDRIRKLAIPARELDILVDRVGELGIAQARLAGLALRRNDAELRNVAEEVERLSALLRDQVLGLRMLPIKVSFPKYRRLVRDACHSLGKDAELVMAGENTELDKAVIEQLNTPCIHLLRNAVDHGIEPPDVREHLGKPRRGTITLSARQEGSDVVIAVADDGGGIDAAKLWQKALAEGRVTADAPFDPAAALDLIFLPGLSTAETVGAVSGRGVGMDAVREGISALRGRIEVQSAPGVGSTFTLRLPVSLAIIDCLEVHCAGEAYYLHLDYVEECLELPPAVVLTNGRGVMEHRNVAMPLLSLRHFFELETDEAACPHVVTVRRENGRAGIVVDAVIGRKQAVLKHLGRALGKVDGVLGGTVTEAGDMALVLDVPGLLQCALLTAQAKKTSEKYHAPRAHR
ncbi:chemotaxis protein CheA [Desulfovibrio aerotolerans]|uniref:Chemotaxis protein CheA n=1 Tax=Solidesulfovibrio aerotolerans TaxID=295255 RepID=A0A7C9MIY3_9BACT|nr:chemotaxis protein CheA [Solidesulfovibrio aerotolerans]MYL81753.1 chemotaxis protein CheA [Solidesulfovibrio aerotolerans]